MKPKILLKVRDPWRREGLAAFLGKEGFALGDQMPDVLLADVQRSVEEIRPRLMTLQAQWPTAALLVLLPELRVRYVLPCLGAGALGVVSVKESPQTLLAAIQAVQAGNVWSPRNLMAKAIVRVASTTPPDQLLGRTALSKAQRRVVTALGEDLSNKEIAMLLHVSDSTVKFHISRLLRKTGTVDRHQLRQFFADKQGSPK